MPANRRNQGRGIPKLFGDALKKVQLGVAGGRIKAGYQTANRVLEDEDLRAQAAETIAVETEQLMGAGLDTVRDHVRSRTGEFSSSIRDGLNPRNRPLWESIRNVVVGDSNGVGRLVRTAGAFALWIGVQIGSFVGAALSLGAPTGRNGERFMDVADDYKMGIAGLFSMGDREDDEPAFNTDHLDRAANVITGHNPTPAPAAP